MLGIGHEEQFFTCTDKLHVALNKFAHIKILDKMAGLPFDPTQTNGLATQYAPSVEETANIVIFALKIEPDYCRRALPQCLF